jgi:hypothetical protein
MNLTATSDKSKIDSSLLIRGLILTLTGDPYLLTLEGQFLEHFLEVYIVYIPKISERGNHKWCN